MSTTHDSIDSLYAAEHGDNFMVATCPEPGCGAQLGMPDGWWIEHEQDGSHTACVEPSRPDTVEWQTLDGDEGAEPAADRPDGAS